MAQAQPFGGVASAALLARAALGAFWTPPEHLTAAALAFAGGRLLLGGTSGGMLALLLGFAGGAVLAALAITVFPEAFEHGGPFVAFATVAGFLFAYILAEA